MYSILYLCVILYFYGDVFENINRYTYIKRILNVRKIAYCALIFPFEIKITKLEGGRGFVHLSNKMY